MRVVLKGIHKVKARLASGDMKIYYYAWRGGPQIKAKPGTPEFVREYHEAHASLRQPRGRHLHDDYRALQGLAGVHRPRSVNTTRVSRLTSSLIEDEFGDLPLAALADRRVRGEFKSWRDRFAQHASQG